MRLDVRIVALCAVLFGSLVIPANAGVTWREPVRVLPAVAPYYFNDARVDPPDPVTVMRASGVRGFTMAFLVDSGGCRAGWYDPKGDRPLKGGADEALIKRIRAAGGDVLVSFGGGDGVKLEQTCTDPVKLAAAYQEVIDAYRLKAIDVDVEGKAYQDPQTQQRVIDALSAVRKANPRVAQHLTIPSYTDGPDTTFIDRTHASGLAVDTWTIMPFDFGAAGQDMGALTIKAAEGLKDKLKRAYGYSDRAASAHSGISSMNGITGDSETVTPQDFAKMVGYARAHRLGRLTYWSTSRDRPCAPDPGPDTCSGVAQQPWEYTRILAQYHR